MRGVTILVILISDVRVMSDMGSSEQYFTEFTQKRDNLMHTIMSRKQFSSLMKAVWIIPIEI